MRHERVNYSKSWNYVTLSSVGYRFEFVELMVNIFVFEKEKVWIKRTVNKRNARIQKYSYIKWN